MARAVRSGPDQRDRRDRRASAGPRRVGYLIAIIINFALLYLLDRQPGWHSIGFLTPATAQVIGLVNMVLAIGLLLNVAYLVADPPWFRELGDLISAAIGLAAAILIWQVFPFTFGPGSPWHWIVRVLIVIAIAGSCLSIVTQIGKLLRGRRT